MEEPSGPSGTPGRQTPPARGQVMASRGHVRAWLVAIVVATVVFSVLYALLEGWSLYDGLYMTIISLTTVGFREVRELDDSGRLITIAASVTGVLLIFGGVGIMSEFVLAEIASGRRERKRMQDRIAALCGHFIVCGYGRVGSTVARELREHERGVVVIDVNESSLERAREDGHLVVFGDATTDATLLAAGIARAAGLVATIDEDAYNVYVVLSARALNRDLFVVGRANRPAAEARLAQAGADRIVSPYTMAGRRIAELAIRPAVSDFIDAALSRAQVSFAIEEHRVLEGDALDGLSVGDLQARGIFTLAIVRGPGEYDAHPPVERILRTGDDLILSASSETLRSLGPTNDG